MRNVRQYISLKVFFSFCGNVVAESVIGCVRDRNMNLSTSNIGQCANCRWTWETPLHSKKEYDGTNFFVWHKNRDTYLCYLCAQSCPDLQQKNPRSLRYTSYQECHEYRKKHMLPPPDQTGDTWDKHFREFWRNPGGLDETPSVANASDSNALQTGIAQLQSVVSELQSELSGLSEKLENFKQTIRLTSATQI